jgi:DNA-directed RNA polymerase sigma subunit (sigma70/sigma32)
MRSEQESKQLLIKMGKQGKTVREMSRALKVKRERTRQLLKPLVRGHRISRPSDYRVYPAEVVKRKSVQGG